ncbi:hypothetical protein K7957_07705 [Sphingomonas yunnanensis]|uniref:hypothetical protein n=1 Tax=Sphingomonas yunnanensis TaxID=310400 RepID=UPI001CA79EF6|nr:hypothetical protein [Sphingomonas yunnanensis]MBY9062813.1 hypothetical protein [Sphingomonas yunnanensis]
MVKRISDIFAYPDVCIEITQFFVGLPDEDVGRRVYSGEIHCRRGFTVLTLILLVPFLFIILLAIAARLAPFTSHTAIRRCSSSACACHAICPREPARSCSFSLRSII